MTGVAQASNDLQTFPRLFKKSNTGAILEWEIFVENNIISTIYGQVGGSHQRTSDVVLEGKNLGKKNETTPAQQAVREARARWKKKVAREGYVEDIRRARYGQTDTEGGIAPMLAQPLEDARHRLLFPCDAQRKYNGVRCIVIVDKGAVSLWSRRRTPLLGVPHIQQAYQKFFKGLDIANCAFDGELYRHGWSLQTISGFVRNQKPRDGHTEISHYVYDMPSHPGTWSQRRNAIREMFLGGLKDAGPTIRMVGTNQLDSLESAKRLHDEFVADGYEGVILRNHDGYYEPGKRSFNLVKVKEFKDGEFEIIDVGEGRGRMTGKAVFVVKTPLGHEFECVAPGTMEDKARYFQEKEKLIGKLLTVKYFNETDAGVPSHGVGLAVRDYE